MEPHFLPFTELTPPSDKTRQRGITNVKDDAHPTSWLRDMLDTNASVVNQVTV